MPTTPPSPTTPAEPLQAIAGFAALLRAHGLQVGVAEQQAFVQAALVQTINGAIVSLETTLTYCPLNITAVKTTLEGGVSTTRFDIFWVVSSTGQVCSARAVPLAGAPAQHGRHEEPRVVANDGGRRASWRCPSRRC